ncbi:MAG: hypothetical protein WC525_07025 [Candidatus Thermoplasmatota archaeon]
MAGSCAFLRSRTKDTQRRIASRFLHRGSGIFSSEALKESKEYISGGVMHSYED